MSVSNKIFIFGLDEAGKTTIVKYLKDKEILKNAQPTRTFEIINVIIEDLEFICWDAPGQTKYRDSWGEKGILETEILMYVVDASDKERFEESKTELLKILANAEVKDVPLIICFHKIDLEESQNNVNDAIEAFKSVEIEDRNVFWLKTSVNDNNSIEDLKFVIYNLLIIEEAQINLDEIQIKF